MSTYKLLAKCLLGLFLLQAFGPRSAIAQTQLSISDLNTTCADTEFSLTLSLGDNSLPLEGITTAIDYNPAVLRLLGFSLSTALQNSSYSLDYSSLPEGELKLSVYATGPLLEEERIQIGSLNFALAGGFSCSSITTPVSFSESSSISVNELRVKTTDGAIALNPELPLYEVSGEIICPQKAYSNSLLKVEIEHLESNRIVEAIGGGRYNFGPLEAGRHRFQLRAKTTSLPPTSAADAHKAASFSAGLAEFDTYRRIAADVSLNGEVSPMDCAFIARYAIGLEDRLNFKKIEWLFLLDGKNYEQLDEDDYRSVIEVDINETNGNSIDFVAIRLGDLSGFDD